MSKMPTNEERRRVADRLRILAGHREVDKELVEDVLGLYMGECVDGYDPVSVVHVADLIEPEPERTCKWIWHEEWDDTPGGRECVCANWELDCGCWDWLDEELSCFDNIESSPNNGWKVCPRCGAKEVG